MMTHYANFQRKPRGKTPTSKRKTAVKRGLAKYQEKIFEVTMKKLLVIAICLILLTAAIVPLSAFAEEQTAAGSQTNLYLINPVALVTAGDYLFVADNVSDTESVILCFDVSGPAPIHKKTYPINGQIVNLSSADGTLYVIMPSSVISVNVGSENVLTLSQGATFAIENAVDFTYGKNPNGKTDTKCSEYALTDSALLYYNYNTPNPDFVKIRDVGGKACVKLDNYIYYLFQENTQNTLGSFNGDSLAAATHTLTSHFVGLTATDTQLVLFNNESICLANAVGTSVETALIISDTQNQIVDVAAANSRFYVLNDKNKVDVYDKLDGATYVLTYNIGSETVDLGSIPQKFDGFTLVKPTGYPTNIIYKTTDAETSVEEIVKNNREEIIILHFEGADELPYYYVLAGDKYGWVKKSDGAATPHDDAKLQKVNNRVSGDVTYNAKFNSLRSVYVYELPRSNSQHHTFNQSVSNLVTPTILQKYVEPTDNGEKIWYYVSYITEGETHFGFVQNSSISSFYPASTEGYESSGDIVDKKINASLFQAVSAYLTADMSESETISNSNGEPLKLYSGDRVTVIKEEGTASFIQAEKDGTLYYGWVNSQNLVGLHQMTTNAIVGIIVLVAAIALAVLFVLLFWRKKSKKGADQR